MFMLDTNISSYVIRGIAAAVDARLRKLDAMQVCISAVTRAELRFGVRRLSGATRLAAEVEKFLSGVHTLSWDEVAADQFAKVRADLERGGTPIGTMDTMIAAHAKAVHAVLVTNNLRHFRRVKDLAIQDWTNWHSTTEKGLGPSSRNPGFSRHRRFAPFSTRASGIAIRTGHMAVLPRT